MVNREEIAFVLMVICFVAITSAFFFGAVLSSRMSIVYGDLLYLPNSTERNVLLSKYQWAWYFPNLVGFIFAVIGVVAGVGTLVLLRKTC